MDARRFRSVWGISLTALTSLIVGLAALGIVFFLLILFSNNLKPDTLSAGVSAISDETLRLVVTWPGIGFLLALAGIIAGFSASPEKSEDERTQACKWICRLGISLSLAAIFMEVMIISYLRVMASALGLA
jgi:hypothetical protein